MKRGSLDDVNRSSEILSRPWAEISSDEDGEPVEDEEAEEEELDEEAVEETQAELEEEEQDAEEEVPASRPPSRIRRFSRDGRSANSLPGMPFW